MFSTSRAEIHSWNESWLLEKIPAFNWRPKENYSSWGISLALLFLASFLWVLFLPFLSCKKTQNATSFSVKAWKYVNIKYVICHWLEPEYCIALLWNHDCITKLTVLMEKRLLKAASENTLNNSPSCDCFTPWIFSITARNITLPYSPCYSPYALEWRSVVIKPRFTVKPLQAPCVFHTSSSLKWPLQNISLFWY